MNTLCIKHVPKKRHLRILKKDCMIFSELLLNSKISCISTKFKQKNQHSKSYSKTVTARQYLETAYSSQGCVKKHDFWTNFTFRRKILTILP